MDEDEGEEFHDVNQRASQFFNKLIEVHWLEPRRASLNEHYVLIVPALRQLLCLFRELAENRPAELKDFAVTLRSLCRTTAHWIPTGFGPTTTRMKWQMIDRSSASSRRAGRRNQWRLRQSATTKAGKIHRSKRARAFRRRFLALAQFATIRFLCP